MDITNKFYHDETNGWLAVKTKVIEVQKDTSGKVDLTEANIIVTGGRGAASSV